MATTARLHSQDSRSVRAGTLTLVLGVLFAAAVGFTYVLSLSDLVNPPTWVRAIGLVWLPIGLAGTPIGYALARTGEGRGRGRVGVAVALIAAAAFIALVIALG